MSNFKELRTQDISHGVIANTFADEAVINLSSPATQVVTNFTDTVPVRAAFDTTIGQASKQLTTQRSDFILVTDEYQKLLGIVASADLQSSKVMMLAQRLGLPRSEISLRYLMTPISNLMGVNMQSLNYSCIGDALQTMEHNGTMFLLVTAKNNEICGLISARDIARKLQISLHISPIAHSFSEVIQSVEHPH